MSKLILAISTWALALLSKLIPTRRRYRRRRIMTLIQIRHACREHQTWVPGRRIPMTEEEFFTHWMFTHQDKVRQVHIAFVGPPTPSELIDFGLTMYANYPEVVEHLRN